MFWIQTGCPQVVQCSTTVVSDIGEAIESVYPMETEDALLVWNHYPIRLSFKYDLSVIIEDIVSLLERIMSSPEGATTVHLGSDTCSAQWDATWTEGMLRLSAKWSACNGDVHMANQKCCTLEVSVSEFLQEWRSLLVKLIAATQSVQVQDPSGLERMIRLVQSIKGQGRLYRNV